MKVKVCLSNNRIIEVEGQTFGSVTVAPILHNPSLRPSSRIFAVRATLNGTRVAAFVDRQIACKFAQSIDRDFGHILPKAFQNSWDDREDAEDKWLLDYIDQRADHPTRWHKDRQQMKFRQPIISK